jgi:uncharacterized protein
MIYAISDLHLSLSNNKPMDIFGDIWKNHHDKIKQNWLNLVKEDDLVLISGDISWAMKFDDADKDLCFIEALPGKKIVIQGNHDYWWDSAAKLNERYKSISFIKNNYFTYKDYAICGARGWVCPNDTLFTKHDMKIYNREKGRLEASLSMAKKEGFNKYIVMLHYPPTNNKKEDSCFIDTIKKYEVEKVVYGHLHGQKNFKASIQGHYKGTNYYLASCDYINFYPITL